MTGQKLKLDIENKGKIISESEFRNHALGIRWQVIGAVQIFHFGTN